MYSTAHFIHLEKEKCGNNKIILYNLTHFLILILSIEFLKIQNDDCFTEVDLEGCILLFKNYVMCSSLVKLQKKKWQQYISI